MKLDIPSLAVGGLLAALLAASSSAPSWNPEECIDTKALRILDAEGRVRAVLTADEDFPRLTLIERDGESLLELGRPRGGGALGLRVQGPHGHEVISLTTAADQFGDGAELKLHGEHGAHFTARADAFGSLCQLYTGSVEEGRGIRLGADKDDVSLGLSCGPDHSRLDVSAKDDVIALEYWPDRLHGVELIRLRKPSEKDKSWLSLFEPDGRQILSR
jgi:hypothetical protein